MTRNIVFEFICIAFMACNSQNNAEQKKKDSVIEILIDDLPGNQGILYSELFDSIEFVRLETTPESLIGRIDKIIYYKHKYFIMDQVQSKSVFVFDDSGKYLGKVGKNGNGPGEYDEPNDIAVDPYSDHILVYVNSKKSIFLYSLEGEYIDKIKLDYWIKSFAVLGKDLYALYFDNIINRHILGNAEHNLLIINKKGKVLHKMFKYEKKIEFGRGGFSFFDRNDDGLLVSPGYSNNIFILDAESATQKYFINFEKYEIPDDFFNIRSQSEFNTELRNSNYAFLNSYFDTPNFFMFSFVSKGKIYNGFYSKQSKELMYSYIFFNDNYGILGPGTLSTCNGDKVVFSIDPSYVDDIKKIYNSSTHDEVKLKNSIFSFYENIMMNLNEDMKKDFEISINLIKRAKIFVTEEEVEFLNTINSGDNPILMTAKLKNF